MIYILSPVDVATGGTELLQQFCAELRGQGADAVMYYEGEYKGTPVEEKFSHYNNPYVYEIEDDERHTLVVPEVRIKVCTRYGRLKRAIWWLSVDNYGGAFPQLRAHDASNFRKLLRYCRYLPQGLRERRILKNVDHLAQSQYAVDYLLSMGIEEKYIHRLSDYISNDFLMPNASNESREDVILYNPKKGGYYTKRLIKEAPGRNWVALSGLTASEMTQRLRTAKVYIDFGDHPGKDRIPREAAACGCCVITAKAGSARNDIDVSIPSLYKFDDSAEPKDIMALVDECLNEYEKRIADFAGYREVIAGERDTFSREVASFLSMISD